MTGILPRLIAITPGDGRDLEPWVEALAGAGLEGILLREPSLDDGAMRTLVSHCKKWIPTVLVHSCCSGNPHPTASGLHLSSKDFGGTRPEGLRGWLGVSTHQPEQVDDAFQGGADYVFLSPVHPPISKPMDRRPLLGPMRFMEIAAERPVYALGGLTPQRWGTLRLGGAFGGAVMGDLFENSSPKAAAARLRVYWEAVSTSDEPGSKTTPTSNNRSS